MKNTVQLTSSVPSTETTVIAEKKQRFNPYKMFVGSFIPNWLMRRTEISQGAKLLYGRLCQYAGSNGLVYATQETIGAEVGVTDRQVRNYLDELDAARLIEKTDTEGSKYYFLWHIWIEEESFRPAGNELPPVAEEDFRQDRKKTSAKESNIREVRRDSYKIDTPVQKLIAGYKILKGVSIDDRDWDKYQFARYSKSASSILTCFGGELEKAVAFMDAKATDFNKSKLSWTLETIAKHAWDNKGNQGERDG